MKTLVKRIVLVVSMVTIGSGLFAAEDLLGRDVARDGELKTIEGVLENDDHEWYLKSGDITYDLHLGQVGSRTSTVLVEGAKAKATGFVVETSMAPQTVETESGTLEVWNKDRYPSWAGSGERRNESDRDDRPNRNDTRSNNTRGRDPKGNR